MLNEDLFSRWTRWLEFEKSYSANTIKAYKSDFAEFLAFLTDYQDESAWRYLDKLKISDVRAWLAHRTYANYRLRSNARALSAIKSFFFYAMRQGNMIPEFIIKFRAPKIIPALPRPLTEQQVYEVINFCMNKYNDKAVPWIRLRSQALFALLYGCGLRINEALSLNATHINFKSLEIRILGKGNKERIIPLLPVVCKVLLQYMEHCPYYLQKHDGPVFFGLRGKRLQAAVVEREMAFMRNQLGLDSSATPHALRHSFASHLVLKGMGLRTIQELLGHASLSSTQIYTDMPDEKLMEIYNHSHPLSKEKEN